MGVDDGLGFVLADRLLGENCAVSTVAGNVSVAVATRNALLYRELLHRTRNWPVYQGGACAKDGFIRDASQVHGEDGLGGATISVDPRTMRRAETAHYRNLLDGPAPNFPDVTLIGIGPATNIPDLVDWYGRETIRRIVLMSGSLFDLGNITPNAEFNAFVDPVALQTTLGLGLPTLMVPLDLCRKVQLDRSMMVEFGARANSDLTRLIATSHMTYMDFYREREGIEGCFPHDAITILAALEPERFFRLRGRIEVSFADDSRGLTLMESDRHSQIEIATGGDLKWVREVIRETLYLLA